MVMDGSDSLKAAAELVYLYFSTLGMLINGLLLSVKGNSKLQKLGKLFTMLG